MELTLSIKLLKVDQIFFKKNSIDAFLGEDGDVCCTSCPKYSFFMPSISKEDLENDPLFSSNRVCNYQNDPLLKDFHWVSAFYDTAGNFSFFAKKDPCIMDFSLVDVLARNGKLRKYEVPAILPEFDSILTLSQIKEGGEITRKRMRDLFYSLMDFTFE